MAATTIKLLDAWKARQGLTSDNQAALKLGITRTTVSRWRRGEKQAAPVYAARMARELELDELHTLAAIEAERAIDADTRRTWARLAGKALGVVLCALGGLTAATLPGRAYAASEGVHAPSVGYIMRSVRRWLRKLRMGTPTALA